MTAIGKGDFVEPLDNHDPDDFGDGITKGRVYQVEMVDHDGGICTDCGDEGAIIQLVGVRTFEGAGWCYCHLRLISGGERGMFDHMLKLDAPNREPVAA